MPTLFEPAKIGRLEIKNRILRSATWDNTADEKGAATDASVALFTELARGGTGLIVTGHAFISSLGQATPMQYGIHTDEMIPGMKRIADAAHRNGAKICVQITHSGTNSPHLRRQGITPLGASEIPEISNSHRKMTEEEIQQVIKDFASAARRVVEAGFDAVQLHGAHSYLLSQFLSPYFNRRTDTWGGSAEKRRRLHLEVIRSVRKVIGSDFPLLMKFGPWETQEGGLPLAEGVETARAMGKAGLDAIEVSAGGRGSIPKEDKDAPEHVYFREQAAAVKKAVKIPVIMVGGIRKLETANEILQSGDADMISLCRPLIREPALPLRWQQGDLRTATCISCNKCMPTGTITLSCGEDRRIREEQEKATGTTP